MLFTSLYGIICEHRLSAVTSYVRLASSRFTSFANHWCIFLGCDRPVCDYQLLPPGMVISSPPLARSTNSQNDIRLDLSRPYTTFDNTFSRVFAWSLLPSKKGYQTLRPPSVMLSPPTSSHVLNATLFSPHG